MTTHDAPLTAPFTHLADSASGELPFAPSCERNRDPILDVLRGTFAQRATVLEIGSGTGQHAVHFAAAMTWLTWQCSERSQHLPGLRRRLADAALENTPPPLELDVESDAWPRSPRGDGRFDGAFSSNTLHIMGWRGVQAFFAGLGRVLADDATLVVYGPFNRDGHFSSDSNRAFDAELRARDPQSGLRDLVDVDALAAAIGLRRRDDIAMPANNRCVVWQRGGGR